MSGFVFFLFAGVCWNLAIGIVLFALNPPDLTLRSVWVGMLCFAPMVEFATLLDN